MTCRRAHLGHAGVPIVHVPDALCTYVHHDDDDDDDDVNAPTPPPSRRVPVGASRDYRSARRDVDEGAWNDDDDDAEDDDGGGGGIMRGVRGAALRAYHAVLRGTSSPSPSPSNVGVTTAVQRAIETSSSSRAYATHTRVGVGSGFHGVRSFIRGGGGAAEHGGVRASMAARAPAREGERDDGARGGVQFPLSRLQRPYVTKTTMNEKNTVKSSSASSAYSAAAYDDNSDSATANLQAKLAKKDTYMLFHPQYDLRQVENVKPAHRTPIHVRDYLAYGAVQLARWGFDKITGYTPNKRLTTDGWLLRFIFLETVAGVPGMVGAMLRHMMSLRTLKRDHGWIHTLLEEAENERMHLLTFLKLREPGLMFRLAVLGAQGVFFNAFFMAYIVSPRTCHRFVGYLEEEAVRTYTHALHDIDSDGPASEWARTPAPMLAIKYWRMPDDATVRDVVVAVRADEASHSHVNHTLSSMGIRQTNPFHVGHTELPENFVEPPAGFVPEHCR